MVKKRDDDSVSTAVATPQTFDHSINPNMTSKEVTLDTTPTSLVVEKEKIDLYRAKPPYHMDGKPYAKSDNRGVLAISALMGHFLPGDGKEVEEQKDDSYRDSTSCCTNVQSHVISAIPKDEYGVKSEGADDPRDAVPSRHASFEVNLMSNSYGASNTSSTSSNGLAMMQFTRSSSSVDDDDDDDDDGADCMEEDLIDLHSDSPSLCIGQDLKSGHRNHRSPRPFPIQSKSFKQAKAPAALRQAHHHLSTLVPTSASGSIPKHEIFFHNLPAKNSSVAEVRSWIASWFLGRDISFEIPRGGVDIGMQQYIDCISWSGEDVHRVWSGSLELDLRGWMLGGYARPIVRDIERAMGMEREREWKAFWGRLVDFLGGAVVMAVVGLLWVLFMSMPMPWERW